MGTPTADFLRSAHRRIGRLRQFAAEAESGGLAASAHAYRLAAARLELSLQDCIRARLEHLQAGLSDL